MQDERAERMSLRRKRRTQQRRIAVWAEALSNRHQPSGRRAPL